ncbi:MAG: glycosyltransferase family 8 protein, partial [Calothrix sp. SM1_7_51]|nr:glycosyltransferase family 8 protein [Calothrix sp. SM1_7_51]
MIRVVCTIDSNYIQHCGVMLCSLLSNNQHNDFYFYIIHNGLDTKSRKVLEKFLDKSKQQFSFIEIDSSLLKEAIVSNHVTIATYFRLLIPELIDTSINKVLFLDSDIIVRQNILQLWTTDISSYVHAAVEDPCISKEYKHNLGVDENMPYFNAGVMLINLTAWRKLEVYSKAIKFIHDYPERIIFWDQDVLNYLLQGQWLKLEPRWNAQEPFFRDCSHQDLGITEEALQQARFNPALVHYTGSGTCKPWYFYCNHPSRKNIIITDDSKNRKASTNKLLRHSSTGTSSKNHGGIRGLLQEVRFFLRTHDSAPYLLIKGCGALLFGASDVINVTIAQNPETGILDPQRLGYMFSAIGIGCLIGPIIMPPGRCYLSA